MELLILHKNEFFVTKIDFQRYFTYTLPMNKLQAKIRNVKDSLQEVRKNGLIPAVLFGKGVESTPLSVEKVAFQKTWKEVGESGTISIETENGSSPALISEVQYDPIKNTPIHIDFRIVDMNKPVEVDIPVSFIGESPAVKSGTGVLVKALHEVKVSALPGDLPHEIEVDISGLQNIDDKISVSDIKVPKGVTILDELEETIVMIAAMKEETEETTPIDLTKIEVEEKGKKKEDEVPAEE